MLSFFIPKEMHASVDGVITRLSFNTFHVPVPSLVRRFLRGQYDVCELHDDLEAFPFIQSLSDFHLAESAVVCRRRVG